MQSRRTRRRVQLCLYERHASRKRFENFNIAEDVLSTYVHGAIYPRHLTQALRGLLTELRPLFGAIPKAKTAKLVRGLIEAISRVPDSTQLQVRQGAMPSHLPWTAAAAEAPAPSRWCHVMTHELHVLQTGVMLLVLCQRVLSCCHEAHAHVQTRWRAVALSSLQSAASALQPMLLTPYRHAGQAATHVLPVAVLQLDVCREQVEWATAEKRTFLRQRIEARLVALQLQSRNFTAALSLIGKLLTEVGP